MEVIELEEVLEMEELEDSCHERNRRVRLARDTRTSVGRRVMSRTGLEAGRPGSRTAAERTAALDVTN